MSRLHRGLLAALLPLGLVLPFLGKPVHVDDANFLRLAEGAAQDVWRPHAVSINWQGSTQPAFEVLSNPPGIAWWLAPLHTAPEWVLHAAMLPWLALALWGAYRLGEGLARDGVAAMLLLGSSPMVVLAAQSLTPDLPLFATACAGMAGVCTARSGRALAGWALLAGCASLFRYSGLCLLPLVIFAGWQRGRLLPSLTVVLPTAALFLHDLHAYGAVHFLAMTDFQGVANTPRDVFRKGVAAVAMLGGVGVLPVVAWRARAAPAALVGLIVGVGAAVLSQQALPAAVATVLFTTAGAVSLSALAARSRPDRLLALWAGGGLLFLLGLRFAAARYWLPFLPAVAIAALRLEPSPRRLAVAVSAAALVSLGVSVDDFALARALQRGAVETAASAQAGSFSGHWGFQHYLEAAGWKPLEEDGPPQPWHARSEIAWPQSPDPSVCLEQAASLELPDRWPGPRVHSARGAGLHSYLIAGEPPVEVYAPWTFSSEPYDTVTLWRRCDRAP